MPYKKKAPDQNLGRPPKVKGDVVVICRTSKQMAKQLRDACKRSGILRSQFLREAIEAKLNTK